jgi:hypothetical protein
MKFKGLDGTEHGRDMSRFIWNGSGASRGEVQLGRRLRDLFPNSTIYAQLPCLGTDLRLDFYIHSIKIAFEFDGQQHKKFNPHFHRDKRGWLRAVENDRRKLEWCEVNKIELIRVDSNTLDQLEELICG